VNTIAELEVQPQERQDTAEAHLYLRIQPTRGWSSLKLHELWEYRELLYFFVWRDVKVRYKQAVLGVAWAVIPPFFTMLIFSLFFGRLAKVPSEGLPYPLFLYAGLIPWLFFSTGLTQATTSLVGSAGLIRKIYFPRLTIPIATVCSGLIDVAVSLGLLFLMMVYYGIAPSTHIIWLPLFVLSAVVSALGVGLWLSALNVQFADVRHAVPFLVQFWMFATPVVYPRSLIGERWHSLYAVNPMVGVVEGFRWSLFGTDSPPGLITLCSSLMAGIVLCGGAFYFRRMERHFADVI
jgi:lipopolysaccharide transport system permease protein